MYQLTITTGTHDTTSIHPDGADAHRALTGYADRLDCRLRPIQTHSEFRSWDLLTIADDCPHATATIEHVRCDPIEEAHFAALKRVLDDAIAVDTGDTLVDRYERTAVAVAMQWDTITGARSHFRAS